MPCCPTCGLVHDPAANFCSRCGRAIAPLPAGDRRVVTVLFADVTGFTRMSESLDPERVAEIVNSCFKALSEPIYRFGGIVDKYIGDAIMALFGAPVAHEDDPERAVSAAYAMQRAAERFSAGLEAETGILLRVRIGLNTGLVVAGAIGGDQKREYTVMGDAVNLAQRLESQADPGSILVSGETYRLTRHAFSYQSARKLFVKGRQEAVYAYELKGPQLEAPPSLDRIPLAGRQSELRELQAALQAASTGTPQWICLSGPAGSGKSRLIQEALCVLPPEWLLLSSRGHAYLADSCYGLLRQLVEGFMDPQAEGPAEARLEAGLAALAVPHPDDMGRRLAVLLGDDAADREKALDAFGMLLTTLGRPVAMHLEDLHWADEESLAWLCGLAEATKHGQLAILLEHREGLCLPDRVRSLPLEPLDREACWQIVLAQLDSTPQGVDPSAHALLVSALERAGGNPMFLRELIKSWIDTALLKRSGGHWMAERQEGISLPSSINALIASRLDQLPQRLRETLQAAAILGDSFSPSHLALLLDDLDGLEGLVKRGLLTRFNDGKMGFVQPLVLEVTYQNMLMSQRRELHRKLAEALEARHGEIGTLARHFRLAGEARKAVPYLYDAAGRAQRRAAHSEACRLLRQALDLYPETPLELPARAELLRALGESEMVLGRHNEALAALQEARSTIASPVQTERLLGHLYERMGEYAQAAQHYSEAIRQADEAGTRGRIQLDLAWLALRQGDHEACLAACHGVIRSPESELESQGMAHSLRGVAFDRLGRWRDAVRAHQEALAIRIRRRDRFGIASSLNNLGMAWSELGSWDQAQRLYGRSLRLYEKIGDRARASAVRNNLGDLAARRGNLSEAERQHQAALSIREALGDRFGIGASRCALGWVLALKGDLDEAGRLIRDGVAMLEAIGERELLAEAYQVLGRIALESRRYPEAEVHLAKALGLSQFDRNPLQSAIVRRLRGQLRLEWGDLAGARAEIAEALRILEGLAHPLELARAQVIHSRLLRAEGRYAEAEGVLAEALRAFEELGAWLDLRMLQPGCPPEILCADSPKP